MANGLLYPNVGTSQHIPMIKEFCRKVQHFPLLSVLCGKNSTEQTIRHLFKEAAKPFHTCGDRPLSDSRKTLKKAQESAIYWDNCFSTRMQIRGPDVSRIAVVRPWRWVCHRATTGGWIRGVLEQYVAGSDNRGRPEGRSYPRSQQATREISGLDHLLT